MLLALCACAGRQRGPEAGPVTVSALQAAFSAGDEGLLTLTLEVANPEASPARVGTLQLEVWMNNHWFTAASSAPPGDIQVAPGGREKVTFELPISFRREGSRPESVFITFGLKGSLQLLRGTDEALYSFKDRQRLEVKNAPVFRTQDS